MGTRIFIIPVEENAVGRLGLQGGGIATRSAVGLQDFLANAQALRRDLDHFVVCDELDRLLQIQGSEWNQANRLVRRGGAHVG